MGRRGGDTYLDKWERHHRILFDGGALFLRLIVLYLTYMILIVCRLIIFKMYDKKG